ncbi:MAG: response regulator [Chloroflexi bacterium]|nr:response regulator [Chloroflexota bacterium]
MAEKILIVDDDLDTLRLVGLMLQRQGYDVRAANNGIQALSMAQAELPDLILLDVMMPDMDGYEVARRLRSDPTTADVPIIMFTAKTQVDDKVAGFEAGADDYLTKPTQPRELFAHMRAVLTRSGKARSLPAAASSEKGFVISVISPKGGLGVSTLALNLGIALREQQNKEVIVAEFRPGQGTMSLELGYTRPEGLNHLLQRKPTEINAREIEAELTMHPSGARLLLASYHPKDAMHLAAVANFEAIARHIAFMARYIVIDLGPGITPVNEKVLKHTDEIILVLEPVPATLTQTKTFLSDLVEVGVGEGRLTLALVNRVRSGVQLSLSQVQEQLGRSIPDIFTPAPELAYQAAVNGAPMIVLQPDSLTAQQFQKLAARVAQRSR